MDIAIADLAGIARLGGKIVIDALQSKVVIPDFAQFKKEIEEIYNEVRQYDSTTVYKSTGVGSTRVRECARARVPQLYDAVQQYLRAVPILFLAFPSSYCFLPRNLPPMTRTTSGSSLGRHWERSRLHSAAGESGPNQIRSRSDHD